MTKVQQGKRQGKKVTSNPSVGEGRQLMLKKKKKSLKRWWWSPAPKTRYLIRLPYESMSYVNHLGAVQTKQSYSFPECIWSRNKKRVMEEAR